MLPHRIVRRHIGPDADQLYKIIPLKWSRADSTWTASANGFLYTIRPSPLGRSKRRLVITQGDTIILDMVYKSPKAAKSVAIMRHQNEIAKNLIMVHKP